MAQTAEESFPEGELWFASRDFISDRDPGVVCLNDGSHHHSRGHDPAGVRACRQRNMACLCAGDSGRVAFRLMHRPLCPPFVVARFALAYASLTLPPWLSPAIAWSLLLAYVATGSSVIGGFYHYANLLLPFRMAG